MSSNPQAPQRRHTGRAHGLVPLAKTVTSNVKRVMTAPAEPTYGHKQVISAYRLKWTDLEGFLKQRFPVDKYPGVKFEEKKIIEDRYIVVLPEALSPDDMQAIDEKRDPGQNNQLEREQSPEA
ncbi:MAG: hypothetical protein L6R37_000168 [Teloschistes peruensis]|nr:MAG: hypothetical protein L6R37_000168 [Teloschistes peruensis]